MSLSWDRPFVLTEDRLGPRPGGRLFVRPKEIVRCDRPGDIPIILRRVQAAASEGLHAAGYIAYEAFRGLEAKLARVEPPETGRQLLWFGLFEEVRWLEGAELDALFGRAAPPPPIMDVRAFHDRGQHVAKVERVLELIQAGDLYQANLTFPIGFRYLGDAVSLYAALRSRQPVTHGAFIATEDAWILSASPELFFTVESGTATVRPMKGTSARGANRVADDQARTDLRRDPKQLAENLMIVDLLRNDLSRVSEPGSVRSPGLFTVETYPTFHAMTSTVTARLRPDTGLAATLEALFPCGSVVGAPKIRAAEVIAELEDHARGLYTGAIGWVLPSGEASFSVAIRTAVIEANGQGRYGTGGGIVADSDPVGEYKEALVKARVLTDLAADYQLVETFGWSPGAGFLRLAKHLARLGASAADLGFRLDRKRLERELGAEAAQWPNAARSVRVRLDRHGAYAISSTPLEAAPQRPLVVHIADEVVDAGDPFLRHKTTRRDLHERAFAEAAASGLDEALLLNRRGILADAARSSLFVRIEGRLVTPPVAAGALPGVLRAELISSGEAIEGDLSLDDLGRHPMWLGSSLRGLRPAVLPTSAAVSGEEGPPALVAPIGNFPHWP